MRTPTWLKYYLADTSASQTKPESEDSAAAELPADSHHKSPSHHEDDADTEAHSVIYTEATGLTPSTSRCVTPTPAASVADIESNDELPALMRASTIRSNTPTPAASVTDTQSDDNDLPILTPSSTTHSNTPTLTEETSDYAPLTCQFSNGDSGTISGRNFGGVQIGQLGSEDGTRTGPSGVTMSGLRNIGGVQTALDNSTDGTDFSGQTISCGKSSKRAFVHSIIADTNR